MVKIGKLSGVSFRKEDSSSATKPWREVSRLIKFLFKRVYFKMSLI